MIHYKYLFPFLYDFISAVVSIIISSCSCGWRTDTVHGARIHAFSFPYVLIHSPRSDKVRRHSVFLLAFFIGAGKFPFWKCLNREWERHNAFFSPFSATRFLHVGSKTALLLFFFKPIASFLLSIGRVSKRGACAGGNDRCVVSRQASLTRRGGSGGQAGG